MERFLLIITLLFTVTIINAQTFSLATEEGDDVTNDTLTVMVDVNADPFEAHVVATNISAGTVDVKVRKIENDVVDGTTVYMCWGVNCYPPTTFETPLAASLESNAHEVFLGDYSHGGIEGTTIATFVFFDEARPTDSAYVAIKYVLEGTNVVSNFNASINNPYPNPAQNFINFDYNNADNTDLVIYNAIGQKVEEFNIFGTYGTLQVNVVDYPLGLYFYEFRSGRELLNNGKFIISR